MIIAIESARFIPSTVLALKIAHCLQCNPGGLFVLEDEDWKP